MHKRLQYLLGRPTPDPDKALDSLLAQPISEEAKRKVLWDNAVRLFGPRMA